MGSQFLQEDTLGDCIKGLAKVQRGRIRHYGWSDRRISRADCTGGLTGNKWEKFPIVTGLDAPGILGIDSLRREYFKDPRGYRWAFGVVVVDTEKVVHLSTLRGLSEDPSIVGLLRVEEQNVPLATTTVHRQQYGTNQDSLLPIQS
ncbi:enteropeptidase [Limosa lapponica baueri]|uniref:Enteropeptidase n=1 Tax=Limosa lapponica baueri TaxID=1758121 RepID=A0A2I0TYE5_LIMLA|nr:enteropeptidase [Limosa lapponica baueri]